MQQQVTVLEAEISIADTHVEARELETSDHKILARARTCCITAVHDVL
jgi:hypothetical protein